MWGNIGAAQGLDQGAHALDALDAPSRDKDGMSPNVMEHVAAGVEREEGVSIDDLEYLLEQLHTEVGLEARGLRFVEVSAVVR